MARKPTVVVVDDEEDIRRLVMIRIEDEFDVIGEASNGREAVAVIKKLDPDIVVMDLMMPQVDGLDAIREIKLVCPRTKIVVLTAAGKSLMAEAEGRGAEAWVDKVKYATELLGIMRSVVGTKSSDETNEDSGER